MAFIGRFHSLQSFCAPKLLGSRWLVAALQFQSLWHFGGGGDTFTFWRLCGILAWAKYNDLQIVGTVHCFKFTNFSSERNFFLEFKTVHHKLFLFSSIPTQERGNWGASIGLFWVSAFLSMFLTKKCGYSLTESSENIIIPMGL